MTKKTNDMTTPLSIINAVFDYYGIDTSLRTSKTRNREIVQARQVSMYFMRRYTKQSLACIGLYFQKDHATIFHSIRHVNDLSDTDKYYRYDINQINNRIFSTVECDEHQYDQYDTDKV